MNIIEMLVPDQYVFPGFWNNTPKWLVLHKTAGFHTAQEVAAYFQAGAPQANGTLAETSVHYVVGQDGLIVRCVRETDGAGGNGVLEAGHDAWWSGNPNLVTYSIEHVDPDSQNATPLTEAQKAASFQLIHDICTRHDIPMRPADANGGITGHYSIDPQSRAHCPGNYPWDELWTYLKGKISMSLPNGWHDTGTELVAPNGHYFVRGFRDAVTRALEAGEDPNSLIPLENEVQVPEVELHANTGPGARQLCHGCLWIWTQARGVMRSAVGPEIARCYTIISTLEQQIKTLQAQIAQLKATTPPVSGAIGEAITALNAQISGLHIIQTDIEELVKIAQPLVSGVDIALVTATNVVNRLSGKA